MMILNISYIEPVNSPDPTIRNLANEQVWKGLTLKVRQPSWVHFTLPGGAEVQNIVSAGPDQALYLTFTYKWVFPEMEAGTIEAQKAEEDYMEIAKSSVQGTIRTLRRMAEKGTI